MPDQRGFWLQCLVGFVLIAAAFGCGWLAYGRAHNATRKFGITVAAPYSIPNGFEPIGLPATPQSTGFSAGDRVDVMVVIDNQPAPLILDALVMQNTKTNFGLLVPWGEGALIYYVRQQQLELLYRPSIVPSGFREAQKELERLRAEGRVKL